VGDIFKDIGAGATVINRSTLTNSMNSVTDEYGREVADALQQIAELVEQSGNADAVENFNALTEELQRPNPRKSLIRSFWDGMLQAVPILADAGAKIAPLLS
jgi:hypothetical protein